MDKPVSTDDEIVLRPAEITDIPKLVKLLHQLYLIEPQFSPNSEKQKTGLMMCMDHPKLCLLLVAQVTDEIVAFANLQHSVSTALGARSVHVDDFRVDENHRGKGIGTKLMEYAMKNAQQIGATRITVNVDLDNSQALSFYNRFNFISVNLLKHQRLL